MSSFPPNHEERSKQMSEAHLRSAFALRELCCRNGGCFIKVGQHLGALDLLLPFEYTSTLKVLHTDAPQESFEEIREVVESELGKPLNKLFSDFSPTPIGAASLAQVHRAVTLDGQEVAVKVQRKDVRAHAKADMAMMEVLVRLVAKVFPEFSFLWLAEETKRNLPREMDFAMDGRNSERAARYFSKFSFLKIPDVFWELSTNRVLTMEFMEGGKVDDRQYYDDHDISVTEVSLKLGELYSEMIFVKGCVHCDPHPGNILVRKSEKGHVELILLDHGLYQRLTKEFRIAYCRLWQSILQADLSRIQATASALGCDETLAPLMACMVSGRSWRAIQGGVVARESRDDSESREIAGNVGTYLPQIAQVLDRVPRQMLLLFKTNDLLRGIESALRGTAGRVAHSLSLVVMMQCCLRSLLVSGDLPFLSRLHTRWQLLSLTLYQYYLRFLVSLELY